MPGCSRACARPSPTTPARSRRSRRSISASRRRAPCWTARPSRRRRSASSSPATMAQASFDAYMLPRHIGLYAGVPMAVPAHLVQRICGTGIEVLLQACDAVSHRGVDVALCVGAESMSRNPVAAYTHRSGFRMGQVEFKDFLWEALLDPAAGVTHGRHGGEPCAPIPDFARRGRRLRRAQFCARRRRAAKRLLRRRNRPGGERSLRTRRLPAARHQARPQYQAMSQPTRMSARPRSRLWRKFARLSAACRPAATVRPWSTAPPPALVCTGAYATSHGRTPLARLIGAGVAVGCPPEIMGIGPVPAIRALLRAHRPRTRRHRPHRDQRSVRRAGDRLRPRARPR